MALEVQGRNAMANGFGNSANYVFVMTSSTTKLTRDGNPVGTSISFGSASNSKVDISSNVVIEMASDETVWGIQIETAQTGGQILSKSPLSGGTETFEFGGNLIITKYELTVSNV